MKWVRPLIISGLVVAVLTGFFMKLVDAEAFWVFATGLIVWWFRSRDEEKRNSK